MLTIIKNENEESLQGEYPTRAWTLSLGLSNKKNTNWQVQWIEMWGHRENHLRTKEADGCNSTHRSTNPMETTQTGSWDLRCNGVMTAEVGPEKVGAYIFFFYSEVKDHCEKSFYISSRRKKIVLLWHTPEYPAPKKKWCQPSTCSSESESCAYSLLYFMG